MTTTTRRTARLTRAAEPAKIAELLQTATAPVEKPAKPKTVKKACKTPRKVTVLRRYVIKQTWQDLRIGDIVVVVTNDEGIEYIVTHRAMGEQHHCSCKSCNDFGKVCYHINAVDAEEGRRKMVEAQNAAALARPAVPVKPKWSDWQACWIDPATKKPAAMLGGVPYWNESTGFTAHPEGKIWNEYDEEWVTAEKPTHRIVSLGNKKERKERSEDLGSRGNLNGASQTEQMPAWLAILPSRQAVTI